MTDLAINPGVVRRAMHSAVGPEIPLHGKVAPAFLYLPRLHAEALRFDTAVVRGSRGSGKSLWWEALQSPAHRAVIQNLLDQKLIGLDERTVVTPGFGIQPDINYHPRLDVLSSLLPRYEPRQVWRAVVAWQACRDFLDFPASNNWDSRVAYVAENPDKVDLALFNADMVLLKEKRRHLIVFDAIDQTAYSWNDRQNWLRGVLQVVGELQAFRAIRAKAFVRPDMLLDREVLRFTDANKVIGTAVDLKWRSTDLYALLWQYLGNAPIYGENFRNECIRILSEQTQLFLSRDRLLSGLAWTPQNSGGVRVPELLRSAEEWQKELFHSIAGRFMGRNPRRGDTYTWLTNHLADAQDVISPRSFLIALKTAAEDDRYLEWPYALHFESIKNGVKAASEQRVTETLEDYGWLQWVKNAMEGLMVPCQPEEILWRMSQADILGKIKAAPRTTSYIPRRESEGYPGLLEEMKELGVLRPMSDGRVNVPDIYRVYFGIGRLGGVPRAR